MDNTQQRTFKYTAVHFRLFDARIVLPLSTSGLLVVV